METTSSKKQAEASAREGPLGRAMALVRVLATAGKPGLALSALAQRVGLPVSTVHRLMAQLLAERLAMQLDEDKRYVIGPLAYELGLVAAQQFDIRELCRPAMERLALASGETVYLMQRSGDEAVCLDLHQGPTTIRVVTLQVGSRRPLGLGAGGLAILASLPRVEANEVLAAVTSTIERDWRFPKALLEQSLADARETGFAVISNRITPGVTAIGRSFNDSLGQVFGAVTVAGLNARITQSHIQRLRDALTSATRSVERALKANRWTRYAARV